MSGVFGGTIPRPVTLPYGHAPCTRCGVVRECRPTSKVCKSCNDTMTARERALWAA